MTKSLVIFALSIGCLLGCSGDKKTDDTKVNAVSAFETLTTGVCACPDASCMTPLLKDAKSWLAENTAKAEQGSAEDVAKFQALRLQLNACVLKLTSAPIKVDLNKLK